MTRQVILDTETTGLSPKAGHRIIEIGCIEMEGRVRTKKTFHCYINPARAVDPGAFSVHGLSDEFLSDKPLFETIVDDFFVFIEGAELIIHNAPFDVGFINAELARFKGRFKNVEHYCTVTDTLSLARKKHPGQKNNLDVLCSRYGIDNKHRALHGALLDAELLAEVYLSMTSEQVSLFSAEPAKKQAPSTVHSAVPGASETTYRIVVQEPTAEERAAHDAFLKEAKQSAWSD